MLLTSIWVPSSLPNTSVQDASALHLGSILTAKYLSSGCFCPLSGSHPHCQILQFRMLLPSIWAPSSLPNTSVHDASALTAGLHPHCQIPQLRMLLPSLIGSILTTKYLSLGCFCPPSGLHPHCQIPRFRMLLPSIWVPSSLLNTSVQDASALHLGSILTAKYLISGCLCPSSGLHPHCQIPQFRMLLPSLVGSILTANNSVGRP